MRLFFGNLPYNANEDDLGALASDFGTVTSVKIPKDSESGQSKGFAFVDIPDPDEAAAAIHGLNHTYYRSRKINVSEARAPAARATYGEKDGDEPRRGRRR